MSWQRELNTTIRKYIRGEVNNIMRRRALMAKLKAGGRITYNHSGTDLDWKVRFKRVSVRTYSEMDSLTFARVNKWQTATLPWRSYAATDMITQFEKLKNRNKEAIVKVYSQMGESLVSDIEEGFVDELYVDGNATGNTAKLHGIESFLAHTTPATNGYIAPPSDTYAGLSTILGNYGGSWSTVSSNVDWPSGRGDAEYDFWSPVIVDVTDSVWTATSDTWAANALQVLRYGITHTARAKSTSGPMDLILLERDSFRLFKELLQPEERIVVQSGDKNSLYQLGFNDVVTFDGVDITTEFGIPSVDGQSKVIRGYGFNLKECELCSLQDELFVSNIPDFDIATQSDRFACLFYGNAKFNPRHITAWKEVT